MDSILQVRPGEISGFLGPNAPKLISALMWLAVTWQQWLPRHWMSWPRAGEMRDGMAVASMFAAALAASVVHAVAALRPAVQRFRFLGW
ncbi:MAG: hypothetical protein AB1609_01235 [Bacillota bacterium]